MSQPLRLRLFALAVAIPLVAGCAGSYHYSQLVGQRYFKVPIETFPVTILAVDGQGTTMRQALVEPGRHEVTVQGPPGATGGFGDTRTVPLEVAACTRYYLVAVKTNRLNRAFSVRVDFEEPVPGCTPPPGA